MNGFVIRAWVAIATAAVALGAWATSADAQVEQSDIGSQQGGLESTQLVTSNAEVRRAVVGLLVIAAVALVVFGIYWVLTGRAAKRRFAHEFGGRHAQSRRPRRGRRRDASANPEAAATAVAPGSVEPPRRRVSPPQSRAEPPDEPSIHAGWVHAGGHREAPVKVHPAWVDQSAPAPARATVARHAAPSHDPERPWRDAPDEAWPRPFEGR